MWHSNAPFCPSGYGQQTAVWVPRLASLGHDMAISAFFGLWGARTGWQGIPVYPGGYHDYGGDVLKGHAEHFKADLIIILGDPFAQDTQGSGLPNLNHAFWCPVDRKPLGKLDTDALRTAGGRIIAFSHFGEEVLHDAGFDPLYVPHGIDTTVFRPLKKRAEIRAAMGLPQDAFIIGINATNKDPQRKGIYEQFEAFAAFRKNHSDALLLVHTNPAPVASGADLGVMADELGISKAIRWADPYNYASGGYTQADMVVWYNTLNLLSNCSFGEGFGLPIIEAQACGVPVVVTGASAMTELAGPGWTVGGQSWWHIAHRAKWLTPNIEQITAAYEEAYNDAAPLKRGYLARQFALHYDADKVLTKYWQPVLAQLETETADRKNGIVHFAGLRWQVDNANACGDMLALGHESELDAEMERMLPDGGTFLDVGAHVGHYALRMARKALKVIAVEANPDTAQRLEHNIKLNDITNIDVHNVAAWDGHTFLRMSSPNGYDRDGSTRVYSLGDGTGEVPALPLDDLLAAETAIDLIKMDVEGADLHVLRGLRATLARCQPRLVIEDHSIYGYFQRSDLDALLLDLGYTWRDLPLYGGYVIADPKEN